jgi:hypothetical protein
MRTRIGRIAVAIAFCTAVAQNCLADWVEGVHPTNVVTADASGPLVEISAPDIAMTCPSGNELYVFRDSANPSVASGVLAIVIAAITTGLPIRVYVSGCDGPLGRPLVTAVGLN